MKVKYMFLIGILPLLFFGIDVYINGELIEPVDCGSTVVYTSLGENQCSYYQLTTTYWLQEKLLNQLTPVV